MKDLKAYADAVFANANKPIHSPYETELYPEFVSAIRSEGDTGAYFPGVYWGGHARELVQKSRILLAAPAAWLTDEECDAPGFQGTFRALFATSTSHRFEGAFYFYAFVTPEQFRTFTKAKAVAVTLPLDLAA